VAKKKKESEVTLEIKKLLEEGKLTMGSDETIKGLKRGNTKTVFTSRNVSATTSKDIEKYANIGGAEVVSVDMTSDELGSICRKPFGISVLSVAKE
jgi:large subunit ribosomal protein L30e